MNQRKSVIGIAVLGLLIGSLYATPSPNFKVFLCFGQSNMSGGSGCNPDAASKVTNPRVKVLAFDNCSSPSRTKNTWSDACEPMHCGDGQNMMGPSYAFGQLLADSLKNDTIGLIPLGLWGVSIEMFMKGKTNTSGNGPSGWGNNAWDQMVTKCKKAMERGVFSGIILEQGESNSGKAEWPGQVKTIYDDLKSTLPLAKDVPFVAGELLQASGACCAGHNTQVAKIPQTLPMGYVASSQGLAAGGSQPQYHFSTAAYRTLGQRFAIEMLKGLNRVAITQPKPRQRVISAASVGSMRDKAKVYSLDGKFVSTGSAMTSAAVRSSMKRGNIYVVVNGGNGAQLMMAPNY